MTDHDHTRFRISSSLAAKLLRTIMGIYFVIAMSTTSVQLILEYHNEKKRLGEAVSKVAETFKPIFSQAVWNLDDEQMESSVDGVMLNDYVLGVKLIDEGGELLAKKGLVRNEAGQAVEIIGDKELISSRFSKGRFSKLFEYGSEVTFESQFRGRVLVGRLVLYSSSDIVLDQAAYTFFITIINAVIKTLFLWFIAFIIIHRIVAKPLTLLTQAINDLNPNSKAIYETDLKLANSTLILNKDELGVLVRAFLTMKEALFLRNKEIIDYQGHLEEKVEARTAELQKASLAKSEFLANMSHEIRTPMNGVLGMIELLKDTGLDRKQMQYVSTVQNSGNALLSVINDVLDYSKIEAGKMTIEEVDFDLEALIDECAMIFAFKASDKNLHFIASVEHRAPISINADPTRLRQVIMNLLGNAFKFTEQGEVSLHVACIDREDPNEMLYRFSVCDTGIGLDENERDQLFKSFSQADSSTTRKYGGSGLGLAISKQLVELMGGEIGVNSEKGVGSTFWFTLKIHKAVENIHVLGQGNVEVLKGRRVLLVDDHAAFNEVMSSRLTALGMEVTVVMTGEAALQTIISSQEENKPFDVALLDYMMPEMNGIELARSIHELNFDPPIKQVLISAARSTIETRDYEGTDILCAIEKPVSQRALRDELVELFGGKAYGEVTQVKTSDKIDYSHMNVLVAEDNQVNQMVIIGLLSKIGIRPAIANNGLEAVDLYANNLKPFDLILMDVEMPILDGWGATKRVRSLGRKRSNGGDVLIVALSAHAMMDKRDYAGDIGMDDYLAKPVRLKDLIKTFENFGFRGKHLG